MQSSFIPKRVKEDNGAKLGIGVVTLMVLLCGLVSVMSFGHRSLFCSPLEGDLPLITVVVDVIGETDEGIVRLHGCYNVTRSMSHGSKASRFLVKLLIPPSFPCHVHVSGQLQLLPSHVFSSLFYRSVEDM